jgi:3D (Asp-Asp-Asp) domain-containing protein
MSDSQIRAMPTYRGIPIVRKDDTIYYGDISKPYVIAIKVKSIRKFKDINLSDRVSVQLIATDPTLSPSKSVIKSAEKNGLFTALDIGEAWLNKALQEAK